MADEGTTKDDCAALVGSDPVITGAKWVPISGPSSHEPPKQGDCLEEEEADKGPGHAELPGGVHAAGDLGHAGNVDALLRDDRDRPREHVSLHLGNSDRYEGEVLDGLMDGVGHYTFADGNVYVGEWRRGKKEGSGTFSWCNGDVYDGEWINGKMEGRGRIVLTNKLTYDGEWRNGKCHGKGQCRYHNGDKFVGEYQDGKRRGVGKLTRSDGSVLEGTWEGTGMSGHGTCEYADGNRYEGAWKDTQRHGSGTHHYHNRWVYQGEWVGNRRSGAGRLLRLSALFCPLGLVAGPCHCAQGPSATRCNKLSASHRAGS